MSMVGAFEVAGVGAPMGDTGTNGTVFIPCGDAKGDCGNFGIVGDAAGECWADVVIITSTSEAQKMRECCNSQ